MPAGAFFKQAAISIRGAIAEKRRLIDDKKRLILDREQAMRQRKEELNRDKIQKQAMAANNDKENSERAVLMKEAQDDVGEIAHLESNFMRERDALLREISDIERDIIQLDIQAKGFEQRASE